MGFGTGSKLPDNSPCRPPSGRTCPVAAFSSVMGLCGLGLAWRAASQVLGAPQAVGESLIAISAVVFCVVATFYLIILVRSPSVVAREFRSPATCCYFGCPTIALLLIAAGVLPHASGTALALWLVGAVGQFLLFLILMGRWISERTDLTETTPAWLIPVVGNATATFAGVPLGFRELSWFLMAVGLMSWLALLPLLLNRLIFHPDPLPARLAPSLAILVSSPAVGCVAWLQLTGRVDEVFRLVFFIALFSAVLVIRLWRLAAMAPISVAWWAYTFPSAALATASIRYRQHVVGPGETTLAWSALALASIVVAGISLLSLRALLRHRHVDANDIHLLVAGAS